MGLVAWLPDGRKQNLEDKHKEDAFTFENRCQVNECNTGRENLRNDYPEIYDKLRTEMGESRFNDDILYNSEIVDMRKDMVKHKISKKEFEDMKKDLEG